MEKHDLKLLDEILVFDNQRFFESWPLCGYDHYAIFYECFRYYYKEETMETVHRTSPRMRDTLIALRSRATELAAKSEDEFLLADVVAMLSGIKLPCTYTKEEFAAVLNESDEDYKAGRFVAQDELREKYGL